MFFSKKKKKRKKDCRQGQGLGAVVGARHGVVETVDGSVEPRAGQRRERCRGGREREPGGGKEADGDGVAPWSRSIPIPIHVCVRAALCRLFSFFLFQTKSRGEQGALLSRLFFVRKKGRQRWRGRSRFCQHAFFPTNDFSRRRTVANRAPFFCGTPKMVCGRMVVRACTTRWGKKTGPCNMVCQPFRVCCGVAKHAHTLGHTKR